MARQALGIAGAVVGGIFGGPQGAMIGYTVGSAIGGIIDPPHFDGPKLADASVQTSRDGVPIPIVWGQHHVSGNIIQVNPIIETTKKVRTGKGGSTTTETTRTRTFAIGIGRGPTGPITGLLRVWENNKLIYDVRGVSQLSAADNAAFEASTNIYLGTEDQLPDPELEVHTGVGNTPAYRGLAYIVRPNYDITNFGSSIPQYRFEILAGTGAAVGPCSEIEDLAILVPDLHVAGMVNDVWNKGIIIGDGALVDDRFSGNPYLPTDGGDMGKNILAGEISQYYWQNCQWYDYCGPESNTKISGTTYAGYILVGTITESNAADGIGGEPNASAELTDNDNSAVAYGFMESILSSVSQTLGLKIIFRVVVVKKPSAVNWSILIATAGESTWVVSDSYKFSQATGEIGFLSGTGSDSAAEVHDAGDYWDVIIQMDGPTGGTGNKGASIAVGPCLNIDGSDAADVSLTGYKITTVFNAIYTSLTVDTPIQQIRLTGIEPAVSPEPSPVIDQSIANIPISNHWQTSGGYYIEWRVTCSLEELTDDVKILSLNGGKGLMWYDIDDEVLVVSDGSNTANVSLSIVQNEKYRLGVVFGAYMRIGVDGSWGAKSSYDGAFSLGSVFEVFPDSEVVHLWREWRGYQVSADVAFNEINRLMSLISFSSVGQIVTDLANFVDVDDIDTTTTDAIEVRGFLAAGGYNVADSIRALQRAYFFDVPEVDGELVTVRRGGASVATILQEDMVRDLEAKFETERQQAVEFPRKLHVVYTAAETDYTPTIQTSERRSPDIQAVSEINVEVPVNLLANEAIQIADKMHKVSWAEFEGTIKFAVSEKYMYLVESDVITVELNTGVLVRVRIEKIIFVDGVVSIEAVIDRASAYSSALAAPTPVEPFAPISNLPGISRFEVMDLPALVQEHDTLHVYVAAHGFGDPAWTGAIVEQLVDTEWIEKARPAYPSGIGQVEEVMAAADAGIDEVNTLLVSLSDDDIASITQDEFDIGGNAALVGGEIINFRDVAAEGDNYRLSYITRGALETGSPTHAIGERFVILFAPTRVLLDAVHLFNPVKLRVYSIGTLPATTDEIEFYFNGTSQLEWAPQNATMALDGGDWIFRWDHYRRIGAPYNAVASVHFDRFVIRLIDGSTVIDLETINESITYTEAAQIADFGAAVAAFDEVQIWGVNEYTGAGAIATPITITGDQLLLENGLDSILLEDGTGTLLLE